MKHLKNTVCATIAPMNEDGSIDLDSTIQLIRFLLDKGISCFYPNGTNGESLSLSIREREEIALAVKTTVDSSGTVFIQCGAASVMESQENIRRARQIEADGIGIMSPVFFPCDDHALEEVLRILLSFAEGVPSYLYNIPSRTGTDISAPMLSHLMKDFPSLLGIKYSAPDLLRVQDYLRLSPRSCDVLIGCDRLALAHMAVGGSGWVSGPAAAFAELFAALDQAVINSDQAQAMAVIRRIEEISSAIAGIPEIPAIKYLLVQRGIIQCDYCRRPLRPLTAQEKTVLDSVLESYTASLPT